MSTIDGEAEMEASSRGLRVRSRYEKPWPASPMSSMPENCTGSMAK